MTKKYHGHYKKKGILHKFKSFITVTIGSLTLIAVGFAGGIIYISF